MQIQYMQIQTYADSAIIYADPHIYDGFYAYPCGFGICICLRVRCSCSLFAGRSNLAADRQHETEVRPEAAQPLAGCRQCRHSIVEPNLLEPGEAVVHGKSVPDLPPPVQIQGVNCRQVAVVVPLRGGVLGHAARALGRAESICRTARSRNSSQNNIRRDCYPPITIRGIRERFSRSTLERHSERSQSRPSYFGPIKA